MAGAIGNVSKKRSEELPVTRTMPSSSSREGPHMKTKLDLGHQGAKAVVLEEGGKKDASEKKMRKLLYPGGKEKESIGRGKKRTAEDIGIGRGGG